jgi:hypothetical protein
MDHDTELATREEAALVWALLLAASGATWLLLFCAGA